MTQTSSGQSESSVVVLVVGIYLVLQAILSFCAYSFVILGGSILSGLAFVAEDAEGAGGVATVGGLVTVLGVLGLILGVVALVVAIGMFLKKTWSYYGAIAVCGIYIVIQVLGWLIGGGFNVLSLLFALASGVAIYFMLTDEGAKQVLGQA
jgi:hypothetical protein